jgi:hypothetical protein
MKEIKYTILYVVCENFCDSILLRFRVRFRLLARYGSSSASQKVTVLTVPVLQRWIHGSRSVTYQNVTESLREVKRINILYFRIFKKFYQDPDLYSGSGFTLPIWLRMYNAVPWWGGGAGWQPGRRSGRTRG